MNEEADQHYCGLGIRGVAMAIDSVVWFALLFVAGTVVGAVTGDLETNGGIDVALDGTPAVVAILLWLSLSIGYHTLLESRSGKTVGKYLVGIRAANPDGSPLTLRASLVRNVVRLVDWLPFFYLVGIAALLASDRYRRLGDRIGDTVVVRS